MYIKRIISLLLTISTLYSISTTAFATGNNQVIDKDTGITEGISELTLEIVKSEDILIATVPLELPFIVDTRGNVTAPTAAAIVNETEDLTLSLTEVHIDITFEESGIDIAGGSTVEDFEEGNYSGYDERFQSKFMVLELFGYAGFDNDDLDHTSWSGTNHIEDITGDGYINIGPGEELQLNARAAFSEAFWYDKENSQQVIGRIAFTLAIAE